MAWLSSAPVFVELLEDVPVDVPELCVLPSLSPWLVDVPVTTDCQNIHLRIVIETTPTSLALRPSSRIALGTLCPGSEPAIIGTNDSEVIRVHDIRPGFQLNRVIATRQRAIPVSEDERAVELVAAPCI